MNSSMLVACALAVVVSSFPLTPPALGMQKAEPSQKEIRRELERLVAEHFTDQGGGGDAKEMAGRREARIRRVLEIVDQGQLVTLDDWDNAAVVLCYADDVESILLGHALGVRPAIADVSLARRLLAFGFDHYLQSLHGPTMFGTDVVDASVHDVLAIDDKGNPLPESLRKLFTLDSLRDRAKQTGKKPSPKELGKLATTAKDAEPAEWLPRLRELVASGVIETRLDLALASELLSKSKEPKDLLVAHVLALCAAFEKHPDGEKLAAQTLDRYLLATGRGQLLGSVMGSEGQPTAPLKLAPRVVLEGYGLLEGAPKKDR